MYVAMCPLYPPLPGSWILCSFHVASVSPTHTFHHLSNPWKNVWHPHVDIHFPAGLPPEAGGPNQTPSESNPALLSLVPAGTWKSCPLVLHSRPYPKPFPHFPRAGVQEPYSGPHPHCSCPSFFESPAPSAQDFCLLQGPDIPQLLRKVCPFSPKGFQSPSPPGFLDPFSTHSSSLGLLWARRFVPACR